MQNIELAWVLGHKIRRWDTDDSYGLIEVTSPPKVPGPPPHYHKNEHEFFFMLKGILDVMSNAERKAMTAGSFIELPPNTVHTFINNTEENVVWMTGWRPEGFQKFFLDFGIPCDQEGAREQSISEEVIQRVMQECEKYGMHLSK